MSSSDFFLPAVAGVVIPARRLKTND